MRALVIELFAVICLFFLGRPEVWLDYGNFIGKSKGGIESFTGIPYASLTFFAAEKVINT